MAIAFNCPYCQFAYRLPDNLAGKQAKCKNPDCRKVITIPVPPPAPDAAALEAAALLALSDEPLKQDETPPAEKVIPVVCKFCDHKWTVPWAKAGKNVLCPNPECRQLTRVDEPKEDVPDDWRQQKTKLPSLAKQNFEKLEGVQDAGDAKNVHGTSLVQADATGIEIEPRPLKNKLFIAFTVLGLIASIAVGVMYLTNRRVTATDDRLMSDARKELDTAATDLGPVEFGLCSALLYAADAEHALRHNQADRTKEAHALLVKARDELRKQPPGPVRNAIAAELALATLAFGGSDDLAKEQIRYRWQPDETGRVTRLNERVRTVHEELRQTLSLLIPADFEFKASVARRLTRELAKNGQATLAADLIPLAMFNDAERDEARAVVALEIWRVDHGSELCRKIAEELKAQFASGNIRGTPFPASAQTLFSLLATDKAPILAAAPPAGTGPISSDSTVLAFTGLHLLGNKPDEALQLAKRGATPTIVLKALVLCAEWSTIPGAALEEAHKVVEATKGKREVTLLPSHLLRLSQLASAAGKFDNAKVFSDALTDDGVKTWAKGDAIRWRVQAMPKEKADESWAEIVDKTKAGHAWGRLWIARHNAKLSHDLSGEKKTTANWPSTVHPFALAGIALGLQDK